MRARSSSTRVRAEHGPRYIIEEWKANGWDSGSRPITRFEAVLKSTDLRRFGFTDAASLDLDQMWSAALDWVGVAGGKGKATGGIRGLPARKLRAVRFMAPWDTAPGLVRPAEIPDETRDKTTWGLFRFTFLQLFARYDFAGCSLREVSSLLVQELVDKEPELEELAEEIQMAYRLGLGISDDCSPSKLKLAMHVLKPFNEVIETCEGPE